LALPVLVLTSILNAKLVVYHKIAGPIGIAAGLRLYHQEGLGPRGKAPKITIGFLSKIKVVWVCPLSHPSIF
jgi:hypothetical protein